jgi:hypothetical protein
MPIHFKDFPDFTPDLSPREIFKRGSFGGTYWRPIYSSVTNKSYSKVHTRYPATWWRGIPEDHMTRPWDQYDTKINKYKVKVGTTLEYWESKHWISESSPYGWVQWYCDFYMGKRSADDLRQIKRWKSTAGPNSRFKKWLIRLNSEGKDSAKIRQTLQHWAVSLD